MKKNEKGYWPMPGDEPKTNIPALDDINQRLHEMRKRLIATGVVADTTAEQLHDMNTPVKLAERFENLRTSLSREVAKINERIERINAGDHVPRDTEWEEYVSERLGKLEERAAGWDSVYTILKERMDKWDSEEPTVMQLLESMEKRISHLYRITDKVPSIEPKLEALDTLVANAIHDGLEERVEKLEKGLKAWESIANENAESIAGLDNRINKLEQKQEPSELEKFGFKGEIAAMDDTIMAMQNQITELQQKQEVDRKAIAELSTKLDQTIMATATAVGMEAEPKDEHIQDVTWKLVELVDQIEIGVFYLTSTRWLTLQRRILSYHCDNPVFFSLVKQVTFDEENGYCFTFHFVDTGNTKVHSRVLALQLGLI